MHVTQTIVTTIGYQIGMLTPETYPSFIPYRIDDENGDGLSGKMPRLLSIIITTLINAHDPSYDPETRTLRLEYGFSDMCQKLRIHSGGRSRQRLSQTLRQYVSTPFPTVNGFMKVAEDSDLDQRLPARRQWIRFTREYVDACTRNVRQIPLDTLPRSAFTFDLLAVTALYTPDNRRLRIPIPDLMRLLPKGDRRESVFRGACAKSAALLNRTQDIWTVRVTGNEFQSFVAGTTPTGSVTLSAS